MLAFVLIDVSVWSRDDFVIKVPFSHQKAIEPLKQGSRILKFKNFSRNFDVCQSAFASKSIFYTSNCQIVRPYIEFDNHFWKSFIILVILWIVYAIASTLILMVFSKELFTTFMVSFGFITLVVFISLCILQYRISLETTRIATRNKTQADAEGLRIIHRTNKMTRGILLVFGICFSPFVLILILIKTLTSHQAFVSTYLRLWFLLVANLNPLLDPVVYCIRMKSVRKRMMKIFTKTENNNEEEEENHKTPWSSRCKRLQYIFKLTDIKWQMTWITDSYSRQETRLWFAFLIKFWPICLKFAWNRLLRFFSKRYKKNMFYLTKICLIYFIFIENLKQDKKIFRKTVLWSFKVVQ